MAQPYVGEIRMFAGSFAPAGWMFCDGSHLPIAENDILFQLIGTTYGGDGQQTFALPDLRGRVPVHQGTNQSQTFTLGQMAGVESVTLNTQQIPSHGHPFIAAATPGDVISPAGNLPANSSNVKIYINQAPDGGMSGSAMGPTGGSQPHENLQPYLGINFIISMFGLWPNQT